jgi:hypothetical protein
MRWGSFALLVLVVACWDQGEEPPGELVGTFNATGLMVEQSCGAAIPAPDPLDLDFELRREEGGRAYWRRLGGSMFAGIHQGNQYSFQVSQSWMVVEPDRFRGFLGCSVTQRDVFTFIVDSPFTETDGDGGVADEVGADGGVDPSLVTMTGSQITEIVPLTGSDCRPAVAALGGPFLSLPCRVEYVLTGDGLAVE